MGDNLDFELVMKNKGCARCHIATLINIGGVLGTHTDLLSALFDFVRQFAGDVAFYTRLCIDNNIFEVKLF